ncbi:MAG: AAA family ATPase [Deltaproteobacteria bacterium]|jgi:hypothetical protein|nr:AAA family ATPase [Deltaproteobacteria bacterium]
MNDQEKEFFTALSLHRAGLADSLEDPALRGVKKGVVDKYSDQAHFIYELIQNADDAKAASARFILHDDRLVFSHNGTRLFSISDQKTEDADQENGLLGDINSITSIAQSSKNAKDTIGKFGVGFKSVFQYTSSPRIYDPNFFFRIDRFIVPILIDDDYPGRLEGETVFELPFDRKARTLEQAFNHIADKLRTLSFPLLFLSNLKTISFQISNVDGFYEKKILNTQQHGDILAESIILSQHDENITQNHALWLFSRKTVDGHSYSAGFFIDDKGNLVPRKHSAFCYFPTKVITELNFIIHAPFILNDSREGIKAGIDHNKDMIHRLAELSADSIVLLKNIGVDSGNLLITDDIFDIIPFDISEFSDEYDNDIISFRPFYSLIKEKFQTEALLPANNGYVSSDSGYWANMRHIAELFSDAQLALLTGDKKAKWAFRSFGRNETQRKNNVLTQYIEEITVAWVGERDIICGWHYTDHSLPDVQGITAEFIENQSIDWLHKFYKWLSETKIRTNMIKCRPIFLDNNKNAVAPYNEQDQIILFLPSDDDSDAYNTIYPELLDNPDTKQFITSLGIAKPSLHDEIYNIILPRFKNGDFNNLSKQFKKLFTFFKDCSARERDGYIKDIKNYNFILCSHDNSEKLYRNNANEIYFYSDELRNWFRAKPKTYFLRIDQYLSSIDDNDTKFLDTFFKELGVNDKPKRLWRRLSYEEAKTLKGYWPRSTSYVSWTEYYIDGLNEILESVISSSDRSLSICIWALLISLIRSYCFSPYGIHLKPINMIILVVYKYFFRTEKLLSSDSLQTISLRTKPWLFNSSGDFVPANQLTKKTLSSDYDVTSPGANLLLDFLGIRDEPIADDNQNDADDNQNDIVSYGKSLGLSDQEQREALQKFAQEKKSTTTQHPIHNDDYDADGDNGDDDDDTDTGTNTGANKLPKKRASSFNITLIKITDEISKRSLNASDDHPQYQDDPANDIILDEDEYLKPSVNLNQKIDKIKYQSEKTIREIAKIDFLMQQVNSSEKYSYSWFKSLLELESLNSYENSSYSREISISFSKVQLEGGTSKTLLLKHPNRFIPNSMEYLSDISLKLFFEKLPTITVDVEVVNVKSYTLRAKLKTETKIEGIDLSLVTEALIEAKNPVFLLQELQKAFDILGKDNEFNDTFNMQDNLCRNIEFVFGPPGTGKTRYLAREIIQEIRSETDKLNILVLTPTNKAADVLASQLIAEMGDDRSYLNWLIRFGTTNYIDIEQSGIFHERTCDIRQFRKNVTVTTIARFPYDYYIPDGNTRLHLKEMNWDFIIIDEASMIPLVNIVYPLYKKKPKKFIIAGDPFQIEPITSVDLWKDENIYSLVKLDSFSNPTTVPHPYPVKLLTTQYRSIPEIGEVFSILTYGGILKHFRTSESQRRLNVSDFIKLGPLTVIKFPVSKFESIYRPKRLQRKSNYQIYSALFTIEFLKYLISLIDLIQENDVFSIGIISPYRAQADLIDKLMVSIYLPKNISVQVGTIHGFQGDECDIVIALFNPPPKISNSTYSSQVFLNRKNIMNVSLSRARDYLFVIMPDDKTENIDSLSLLKKVERLCKERPGYVEHHSNTLEQLMFGSPAYIEDNAFSTSHQLINVYSEPEMKYEIRSEDNAVDIQVHK